MIKKKKIREGEIKKKARVKEINRRGVRCSNKQQSNLRYFIVFSSNIHGMATKFNFRNGLFILRLEDLWENIFLSHKIIYSFNSFWSRTINLLIRLIIGLLSYQEILKHIFYKQISRRSKEWRAWIL
jgi:hypothetical protein